MKPETLEALKGSIEKWRRIVEGTEIDRGPDNCPLCQLFNTVDGCDGCPVRDETSADYCEGSPYTGYTRGDNEAARAELEFLRSLLPQEEAPQ